MNHFSVMFRKVQPEAVEELIAKLSEVAEVKNYAYDPKLSKISAYIETPHSLRALRVHAGLET
jgi:hypothetical protein